MKLLKKMGKLFLSVLPHINIALAVTLLTLFVTDRYNRAMAFINNDITKWMIAVFSITVFIEAITLATYQRRGVRQRNAATDATIPASVQTERSNATENDVSATRSATQKDNRFLWIRHFRTITRHRHQVIAHCFKAGIGWQGLFHDLSKYSPIEFGKGAHYYQGKRSPNEAEREDVGYSLAWMHHKGRNRHHFEYWNDVNPKTKRYEPVEMPLNYLIEMLCDRVAACKIYKGKDYTDASALEYYLRGNAKNAMHPQTATELERLLRLLADRGETAVFTETKRMLKVWRKKKST